MERRWQQGRKLGVVDECRRDIDEKMMWIAGLAAPTGNLGAYPRKSGITTTKFPRRLRNHIVHRHQSNCSNAALRSLFFYIKY